MTVGITAIPVEPPIGPVEALDHSRALEGLEVLVNGGVADVSTTGIELLEDVSCTEMVGLTPEQIEHHASLPAETHAELTAAFKGLLHPGLGDWVCGGIDSAHRRIGNDFTLRSQATRGGSAVEDVEVWRVLKTVLSQGSDRFSQIHATVVEGASNNHPLHSKGFQGQ
jgi:hypothetical protein